MNIVHCSPFAPQPLLRPFEFRYPNFNSLATKRSSILHFHRRVYFLCTKIEHKTLNFRKLITILVHTSRELFPNRKFHHGPAIHTQLVAPRSRSPSPETTFRRRSVKSEYQRINGIRGKSNTDAIFGSHGSRSRHLVASVPFGADFDASPAAKDPAEASRSSARNLLLLLAEVRRDSRSLTYSRV